jgi:hypothetical protein
MNAFLVDLANKPGALADVAEALGAQGINIQMVSGAACGDSGRVAIGTDDDVATRRALEGLAATFTEVEPVEVSLPHTPGSLGKAARRLAAAGINIDAITPTGMSGNDVTVAFLTDDPARTREILSSAGSVA